MPDIVDKDFENRIKRELGEEANPLYVEHKLNGSIPDILGKLHDSIKDLDVQTFPETIFYAENWLESNNPRIKSTLLLGMRILISNFKTDLFILNELKERIEAIEASSKEPDDENLLPE